MKFNASNALINIQANMNKSGDFEAAVKVADKMVELAEGNLALVEADAWEGNIVLSAVWNNYQAKEWKELYEMAKTA